jgi:hypothetical protein
MDSCKLASWPNFDSGLASFPVDMILVPVIADTRKFTTSPSNSSRAAKAPFFSMAGSRS